MPGVKTNERPGTRATAHHSDLSAFKAREVLDLIRGKEYVRAVEILAHCDRGAAQTIGKVLSSCAANAENNDDLSAEEMFVSACYADEGPTLKRWRPRARGRATRIRKRTCHITVILSRMSADELTRRRARSSAEASERRARRVAGGRRAARRAATEAEVAPEAAPELAATAVDEPLTDADDVEELGVGPSAGLPAGPEDEAPGAEEEEEPVESLEDEKAPPVATTAAVQARAADREALAALREARGLEEASHRARLEANAEAALGRHASEEARDLGASVGEPADGDAEDAGGADSGEIEDLDGVEGDSSDDDLTEERDDDAESDEESD
ncbi:MAG: 50S ribosomal protein L22 [Acidimicrobiales bacterium]